MAPRTLAMMAAAAARLPVLILNRGVSFPLGRFQRLGYTSRRVNAIVAVCESIREALVRSGVDAKKIEVIYSGTDTARFYPGIDGTAVRLELGFQPGDFVITQIGVRSWKGNDDVILAMMSSGIARTFPRSSRHRIAASMPRTPVSVWPAPSAKPWRSVRPSSRRISKATPSS
jgi:glycosyl transferase family 4